jgi:hypothetical protein
MRFLRMFSNALVGGLLAAAFITVLVLQLNRHVPLDPRAVAPLYLRLALFYTPHLTVAFYSLIVVRDLLARRALSPGWLSVRILSWLGTLIVSSAAVLMWLNHAAYRVALDEDAGRRLVAAAGATSLCAVLLTIITVIHYSFGRRGSRVGTTLLALTLAASLLFPLASRGVGEQRPLVARAIDFSSNDPAELEGAQITIVALDGASLDDVAQAVSDGKLPAFGRLLEGGVSMYLETLRPTQPAPVWTTVATGKYPPGTGIRAAAAYEYAHEREPLELLPDLCFAHALVHFGILREVRHGSSAVRARPLWAILSSQQLPVGVVGWPVTVPASPLRGFLITDRFRPGDDGRRGIADTTLGYPADAVLRARAIVEGALAIPAGSAERPPIASDAWNREIAVQLRDEYRPRLLAVRYEGIDRAGHLFLRYARPREFGNVSSEDRVRLGTILDQHYAFLDAEIGHLLETLGPRDMLLVVSGFGMEPIGLAKRALARALGQPEVSGTHENAPDGFLLAYGAPVRAGRARLGSIVDITPTVLYFLGLPVGRDMDGVARIDIFKPAFTAGRPITFIPSYDR